MNERIRQLVEDANLRAFINPDGSLTPELHCFTELIVRECADFVREYPEKYLTHNQAREISFGMEEHFGVEE